MNITQLRSVIESALLALSNDLSSVNTPISLIRYKIDSDRREAFRQFFADLSSDKRMKEPKTILVWNRASGLNVRQSSSRTMERLVSKRTLTKDDTLYYTEHTARAVSLDLSVSFVSNFDLVLGRIEELLAVEYANETKVLQGSVSNAFSIEPPLTLQWQLQMQGNPGSWSQESPLHILDTQWQLFTTIVSPRILPVFVDPNSLEAFDAPSEGLVQRQGNKLIEVGIQVEAHFVQKDHVTMTEFVIYDPTKSRISLSRQNLEIVLEENETNYSFVELQNTGKEPLNFITQNQESWLSVSPNSGTLEPEDSTILTILVDTSGIPVGSYSDALTISATNCTNSPSTVEISLSVIS